MVCLGGLGRTQTLAPHFHYLRREPAIGALAGGEPGFGATVMPSHSQAPSPKGKRKRGHCGAQWARRFPIRNAHPECLQVPALASNTGPGSELRAAVALPLGLQFSPPRPGEPRGLAGVLLLPESATGRAAEAQVHPQHRPRVENPEICGICDPGRETLSHTSLLLPCLWAFYY